jgi:hypothetical protein
MRIGGALAEVERLSLALRGYPTAYTYRVFSPQAPFRNWSSTRLETLFGGKGVSAPDVVSCYGVYLLATTDAEVTYVTDAEVIYIGKATPRVQSDGPSSDRGRYHLGAEIWNKICELGGPNEAPVFGSGSPVAKAHLPETVRQAILLGDILVTAVEITPWTMAACVESYLRAAAFLADARLPAANDRIG